MGSSQIIVSIPKKGLFELVRRAVERLVVYDFQGANARIAAIDSILP